MNLDFSALRILVYGDVMLDEYVHGVIERISPEAPVPVLSRTHSEYRPGGAANVAANVAALGAQVTLCGIVGDFDEVCAKLSSSLPNEIKIVFIYAADRTSRKTRHLAQRGHYVLRIDEDGSVTNESEVITVIGGLTNDFDAIIVSDYAKGAVTKSAMKELCAKGMQIFVDPKQNDWSIYSGAAWFTPNEKEWKDSRGWCEYSRGVLITRGEHGMTLLMRPEGLTHCDAVAQQVADVTGAGDTVIAAFTCAVTAGNDPVDAMRFANAAAGVAVSKSGTATVTIDEATAAFQEAA